MWSKQEVFVVFALVCAQSFVSGDVVVCGDHGNHTERILDGASVTMTKTVTYVDQQQGEHIAVDPRNDIEVGDCSLPDLEETLIHECVEAFPNGIITLTFNIQLLPEDPAGTVEIHCIHVHDEVLDGDGGTATIEQGGVGFDFVVINVTSQVGKGVSFLMGIFAHQHAPANEN